MALQEAARVGDPINHRSEVIAISAGIVGAVLGTVIVVVAAPISVATAIGAVGVGLNLGGTLLIVGDFFRSLAPMKVWGHIVTGAPSVHIGHELANAANASPTTRVDCHTSWVSEGSRTVSIEYANASRVADHTACGGVIADGCATVLVGGEPAYARGGKSRGEAHGATFNVMMLTSSFGGPSISMLRATKLAWASGRNVTRWGPMGTAATEFVGAGVAVMGLPAMGRTIGAAGNTAGLWLRYRQLRAGDGTVREFAIRAAGTGVRIGNAGRELVK